MESVLANGLLARFRIARDPKDAEESADISRRLLTLDPRGQFLERAAVRDIGRSG